MVRYLKQFLLREYCLQITVINKEVKEVLEGDGMVPPSSSIANTSVYHFLQQQHRCMLPFICTRKHSPNNWREVAFEQLACLLRLLLNKLRLCPFTIDKITRQHIDDYLLRLSAAFKTEVKLSNVEGSLSIKILSRKLPF